MALSAPLTLAQKQTIKAYILANLGNQGDQQYADAMNATAAPDYFVWKTTLNRHDLTDRSYVGDDGSTPTNFVWGGTQGGYVNRSQGERDAYNQLFNTTDACKPNLANVRTAMEDIFSGSGAGAVANRAQWRAAARRPANIVEKLFVAQTVGGPTQTGARGSRTNPDTLVVEGTMTAQDVVDSLNS